MSSFSTVVDYDIELFSVWRVTLRNFLPNSDGVVFAVHSALVDLNEPYDLV